MARSVKIDAKQRRQASIRSASTADVEKAVVLAGEAGRRQVLGGRRTARRDRDIGAALFFERAIGRRDLGSQTCIAGGLVDELPGGSGALGAQRDVMMVEAGKQPA